MVGLRRSARLGELLLQRFRDRGFPRARLEADDALGLLARIVEGARLDTPQRPDQSRARLQLLGRPGLRALALRSERDAHQVARVGAELGGLRAERERAQGLVGLRALPDHLTRDPELDLDRAGVARARARAGLEGTFGGAPVVQSEQ